VRVRPAPRRGVLAGERFGLVAWIERAIEERDQVLVSLKGYMTWHPGMLEGFRSRLDECGL